MWEMIKSMDNSSLGDDVMGEDPTINELEEKAARITGKETALYISSGTQGNLISILAHTTPGDEILLEEQSHIFLNEVGSAARIANVMVRPYLSKKGVPSFERLQNYIRESDIHHPTTRLLCTENTHNYHGGVVIQPNILKQMKNFANKNNLKFHLDGARIFNASVALNLSVKEFTSQVDSVMFCLSKGLSCPIGSILAGSQNFIDKARRFRKMLGGGMRQAGIIASFGLIALEPKWIKRLEEDHKNAKLLAEGLKELNFPMKVQEPETNILMVEFPEYTNMRKLITALNNDGILAFDIKQKIRFVTHYGINEEDIQYSIDKIAKTLEKL
jgi:threonine aldolase